MTTAESTSPGLPSWADQMRALEHLGDDLVAAWRPDGVTAAETQDMYKLALSILSNGYLCRVYSDATRPVFMPLWNFAFNQGGPDPDYVYSTVEIDPAGVYRISGFRGTTRFVEITQQTFDILRPANTAVGNSVPGTHDLDDLALGDDGSFSVILSAQRPDGHDGDWWEIGTETKRLLMRKCSCDWRNEQDARVAIDRLDVDGQDMTPEESARRFSDLAAWVEGMIGFDMELVRWYREHHGVNTFMRSTKVDSMGGLPSQIYYDGIYEIADDEALVVETDLPERCRYWQALVADDRFCTVDWVNRQSSLNDIQARVDADGRFRFVVSKQDPGVPNWLDKADYPWGVIQMRLNQADSCPEPTIVKVKVSEVRTVLPVDTPIVTADERREHLRARREGAQLRRIW
jgi:hypothetical protein